MILLFEAPSLFVELQLWTSSMYAVALLLGPLQAMGLDGWTLPGVSHAAAYESQRQQQRVSEHREAVAGSVAARGSATKGDRRRERECAPLVVGLGPLIYIISLKFKMLV